jgi:hypothetical protein
VCVCVCVERKDHGSTMKSHASLHSTLCIRSHFNKLLLNGVTLCKSFISLSANLTTTQGLQDHREEKRHQSSTAFVRFPYSQEKNNMVLTLSFSS